MFHQKCFSGTNQNKQNQTSLLLVAPLPKGSWALSDTASVSDAIECIQPLNALPLTFFYAAVFDELIQVRQKKMKGIFWIGWKIFYLLSMWLSVKILKNPCALFLHVFCFTRSQESMCLFIIIKVIVVLAINNRNWNNPSSIGNWKQLSEGSKPQCFVIKCVFRIRS